MLPQQRIVTRIPLFELWDSHGTLELKRGPIVGKERISELLRLGRVKFVVADCGLHLDWIPDADCFSFWKSDAKSRVVEPDAMENGFSVEDYPGGSCFICTEWGNEQVKPVLLLEKYH